MKICIAYMQFPETDTNAGSVRLFEIVSILCQLGHSITFLAQRANAACYRSALVELGVECVCDDELGLVESPRTAAAFLGTREFDAAVFPHYYVYNVYSPIFRALLPSCHQVLDTVDLHHVRMQREADLLGGEDRQVEARRTAEEEIAAIRDADSVWVVTNVEKTSVQLLCDSSTVHTIPTIHWVEAETPGFEQRDGIVFLGGYRHSPNVDAVDYFVTRILPGIREQLPDVKVSIAGSYAPPEFQRYAETDKNLHMLGFVEDHRALLKSHRVGIAPLRYGAGMKGKIGDYLSCGLACVSTSIGIEGMSLRDGNEVLVADSPDEFGSAVVRLHSDRALWELVSSSGYDYIRRTLSRESAVKMLEEAIRTAAFPSEKRVTSLVAKIGAVSRRPVRLPLLARRIVGALRRGGAAELRVWLANHPGDSL